MNFDVEAWPLVIMTCAEHVADATVEQMIAFFESLHARKELFVLMVDTRAVQAMPSAKWRKALTDWTGDPHVQLNSVKYNVGTAVVLSSALARGVFVAIGWLWKPASPVTAHGTIPEAFGWCCERLAQAGVARSPKLIELQRRIQGHARAC